MANNLLIGLGIIGILGTGSTAVIANTQALAETSSSSLIDASDVLLLNPLAANAVTTSEPQSETPSNTPDASSTGVVSSDPQAPTQLPGPAAGVAPMQSVPVDATSSGSSYSESEDEEDEEGEEDDDEGVEDDD